MKTYSYRGCIVRVRETEAAKAVGGIAPTSIAKRPKRKRTIVELCAGTAKVPLREASDEDFKLAASAFSRRFPPLPKRYRPNARVA